MRRRDFISLVGGAAAWPLAARAQQPAMPVIGLLDHRSPEALADRLRGFHQGLKEAGYIEGQNVAIDYRWAENQDRSAAGTGGRSGSSSGQRDRRRPEAFLRHSRPRRRPRRSPIVFLVSDDPVKLGLVASLARPGGNLTGINFFSGELTAKRLELLRELVPAATRVAVLVNPANAANTETHVESS